MVNWSTKTDRAGGEFFFNRFFGHLRFENPFGPNLDKKTSLDALMNFKEKPSFFMMVFLNSSRFVMVFPWQFQKTHCDS
jgi:hypothetical protein